MVIPDLPEYIKISQMLRNQCLCIPITPGKPVPDCGVPGATDAAGLLELQLLNVQMGMMGISDGGCGLFFYTYVIVYNVNFGPSGAYNIQSFDKFQGVWNPVMFSGVLYQTTGALNSYGPFLTVDQIPIFWNNVKLPPINQNGGTPR